MKWEQHQVEYVYSIGTNLTLIYLSKWNVKFYESNEHILSKYCVYWEKLCIFNKQMKLFEEKHVDSDLIAPIWDLNKLSLELGKLSEMQIRQVNVHSFEANETIYFRWTMLIFNYFRWFLHGLTKANHTQFQAFQMQWVTIWITVWKV